VPYADTEIDGIYMHGCNIADIYMDAIMLKCIDRCNDADIYRYNDDDACSFNDVATARLVRPHHEELPPFEPNNKND
jgi:hypothetical protein